jgi:hypothetical protein
MHLRVTIEACAIDGKNVESLSGGGRMARQHVNVALLTYQMSARRQKLCIV